MTDAVVSLKVLLNGRTRMLELGEVFSQIDPADRRREAKWLGSMGADKEELAINDIRWILDDAKQGTAISADDRQTLTNALHNVAESWKTVRAHWRKSALADIQGSRDMLLELRDENARANKEDSRYFWIDRDLAFVFTSIGGFFMDYCMEDLYLQGLREGKKMAELASYGAHRYVAKDYQSPSKEESRKNYRAAQTYYESFIQRHEAFEKLRVGKAANTNFDDVTANPFLVDLVSRYKSEMFEAVQEDKLTRKAMLLQLCALVVDPIYQVNDLEKAKVYAGQLRAMDPRNPIHHFVRATACFEAGEYDEALPEYDAYMKVSSIVEDAKLRKHVRERMELCRRFIKDKEKSSGASGE